MVFLLRIFLFYVYNFFKNSQTFGVNNDNEPIVGPSYLLNSFHLSKELALKNPASGASQSAKIKIPIIMYHHVECVKNIKNIIRKRLDISSDVFLKELTELNKSGFNTYWVKEIPEIISGRINLAQKSVVLTFDDGYEDFYRVVFPIIKKYQMKATVFIIFDYIGKKGFLNEYQIKELIDSGLVEIGSHTLDHAYLQLLPDSFSRRQIFESKMLLEQRFGVKIESFAYPYGAFNKNTLTLVKEAGYKAAVSVIPGVYQSHDNLFYLFRLRPSLFTRETVVKFLEKYKK